MERGGALEHCRGEHFLEQRYRAGRMAHATGQPPNPTAPQSLPALAPNPIVYFHLTRRALSVPGLHCQGNHRRATRGMWPPIANHDGHRPPQRLLYPLVAAVAPPSSPLSPSSSTAFLEVVCLLRPDFFGRRSSYSTHLPLVLFSPRTLSLSSSFSLSLFSSRCLGHWFLDSTHPRN